MSLASSLPETPTTFTRWFRQHARVPIVVAALGLILYYTIYLVVFVPMDDVDYSWQLNDVLTVTEVPANSPAAPFLQPDDIVLSIDGEPARWTIWRPSYTPGKQSYEYTVQRGDQILAFTIPVSTPTPQLIRERVTTGIVSLLVWLVAAFIILFATPQNSDAWQLGLTTLGTAVVLAASEAALYGVPGAWLNSNPFLPMVAVALAQMALLPRKGQPSPRERTIFHTLYIIATLVGLVSLFELLYLNPRGDSLARIAGISLYELLYMCLGLGGLAHVSILAWRFWRLPSSYQRRQILIILTFTAVAILPTVLLTILPRLVFGAPLLPWDLSIALYALIPAGYGFVIYRKNYLGLDIFATNTLTWLLISLLLLSAYSIISIFIRHYPTLVTLEPLPGTLFFFPVLLVIPRVGRQIQGMVEQIVCGSETPSQKSLLQFITSALSADPQVDTLRRVVHETAALMQVRQIGLMLADSRGQLVCIDRLRVKETISPIIPGDLSTEVIIRQSVIAGDSRHFLLDRYPWVDCAVPLSIGGAIVGVLLLGRRLPDGYFTAKQITFLCQVADVMAVAAEAMRLFESSREMSRELLRVRDEERMQLASLIHDEPLQRITMVASGIGHLADQVNSSTGSAETISELHDYGRELQATSKQLRDICAGLHPPVLRQGAQWAVKEVIYAFQKKIDLDIRLDMAISNELLVPREITIAIYYVLIEALNNVQKHAQAATVWVRFAHENGQLVLTVEDDGVGNSVTTFSLSALFRAHHFGVVGMHEWASLVKGKLTIEPRAGGGTAVILKVPFALVEEDGYTSEPRKELMTINGAA